MRILRWTLAIIGIVFASAVVYVNHLCSCSVVHDPAPDSPLGQALAAVAHAQEAIHRRHGRYAESEVELAQELLGARTPSPIRELEIRAATDGYIVRFETDHRHTGRRRTAFCSVIRFREPGDSTPSVQMGCEG